MTKEVRREGRRETERVSRTITGKMLTSDLCLCNLIVMVRELEVHSSCMDVRHLPQNVTGWRERRVELLWLPPLFHSPGHDRALDVPAWPALSPRTGPGWLSRFASFPQSKVISTSLLSLPII